MSELKNYDNKNYAITLEIKPFCGSIKDHTTGTLYSASALLCMADSLPNLSCSITNVDAVEKLKYFSEAWLDMAGRSPSELLTVQDSNICVIHTMAYFLRFFYLIILSSCAYITRSRTSLCLSYLLQQNSLKGQCFKDTQYYYFQQRGLLPLTEILKQITCAFESYIDLRDLSAKFIRFVRGVLNKLRDIIHQTL